MPVRGWKKIKVEDVPTQNHVYVVGSGCEPKADCEGCKPAVENGSPRTTVKAWAMHNGVKTPGQQRKVREGSKSVEEWLKERGSIKIEGD